MVGIVENKYAEALYKLAMERGILETLEQEVLVVKGILEKEEDFIKILCHPQVVEECKLDILKNIFKNKLSDELMGLLLLVVKKNRQDVLINILNAFLNRVKGYKNINTAVVTTAIDLSNEYIEKIRSILIDKFDGEVEIKTKVDTSIIGGLKININNRVFDRTLNTQIENLKEAL